MEPIVNDLGGWAALTVLCLNAVICISVIGYALRARDPVEFWAPPVFVAAVYSYYAVVGPVFLAITTDYMSRLFDMREFLGQAWTGSAVAQCSFLLGYFGRRTLKGAQIWRATEVPTDYGLVWRLGRNLTLVGGSGFVLTTGAGVFQLLIPIRMTWTDDLVGFSGYLGTWTNWLSQGVNFPIAGVSMMLLSRLGGGGSWMYFGTTLTTVSLIYVSLGFRYRLVLLYGGMIMVYYLMRRSRPPILSMALLGVAILMFMGEIGKTRTYGSGLNLEGRSQSFQESLGDGFHETVIFPTAGAVIAMVPGTRPHVWFEPLKQTLLLVVPSQLWDAKDTMGYTRETLMGIFGETHYVGAAYMSFAEAYLAFSWPGVVVAFFGLGWVCHWLWTWYGRGWNEPLRLVVYATCVAYLYVALSRGYLPQLVMLFFFTVFPSILVFYLSRRLALRTVRARTMIP